MGFEVVVRPVVFPNIRPQPAQSQPPASDPTQGLARINGSSGQFLDLQYSNSINSSSSHQKETKRIYDVARVYQQEDPDAEGNPGKINKDNFVDINVAKKIYMKDGQSVSTKYNYVAPVDKPNIKIIERNKVQIAKPQIDMPMPGKI